MLPRKDILTYGLIFWAWILLTWLVTGGYGNRLWFAGWWRWDAIWYEKIAQSGYRVKRLLAFPPVYPSLIGFISKASFLPFHAAAFGVNALSYFAGLVILSETLTEHFKLSCRFWLFAFALSAPASYFMFAAYTDSLFFFLLWL